MAAESDIMKRLITDSRAITRVCPHGVMSYDVTAREAVSLATEWVNTNHHSDITANLSAGDVVEMIREGRMILFGLRLVINPYRKDR